MCNSVGREMDEAREYTLVKSNCNAYTSSRNLAWSIPVICTSSMYLESPNVDLDWHGIPHPLG